LATSILESMDDAIIGWVWCLGMLCGALTAIGVVGAVSGRVLFNPRRIDWSVGEARILGLIWAIQGMALSLILLFGMVQLAANSGTAWFLPLVIPGGGGGFLAVVLVGQHHNRRHPAKNW
jgi:hypothetical protein